MEPIQRVTGPSGALDAVGGVHRLAPVEREDRDPGRERRRRRPAAPREPAVERDADGRPHVDIRA